MEPPSGQPRSYTSPTLPARQRVTPCSQQWCGRPSGISSTCQAAKPEGVLRHRRGGRVLPDRHRRSAIFGRVRASTHTGIGYAVVPCTSSPDRPRALAELQDESRESGYHPKQPVGQARGRKPE